MIPIFQYVSIPYHGSWIDFRIPWDVGANEKSEKLPLEKHQTPNIFYFIEFNENFLLTFFRFSVIFSRIWIRTNKFWTQNYICKSYTIWLATDVAFFTCFSLFFYQRTSRNTEFTRTWWPCFVKRLFCTRDEQCARHNGTTFWWIRLLGD